MCMISGGMCVQCVGGVFFSACGVCVDSVQECVWVFGECISYSDHMTN